MKILVVEDIELKATTLAACVTQCDPEAKIVHVTNAVDAFDKVAGGEFNLVLLDVLLPMRVGAEPSEEGSVWFVREVHRKMAYADLPLIVGTTQHLESLAKVQETFREYLWSILYVADSDGRWRQQVSHAVRFAKANEVKTTLLNGDSASVDVAVVTALRMPEFEAVVNAMDGGDQFRLEETNETWMRCEIQGEGGRTISVVAACADEMGMCAMGTLVTRLSIACRPKKLILAGIMGGNAARVGMSDLILVEETWDCRSGKITERGFEADTKSQRCSFKLSNAAKAIVTEQFLIDLWKSWNGDKPRGIPRLHAGAVACSPAVIADDKVFKELEEQKRKVFGVEMEAFGCFDAVHHLGDLAPGVVCVKSVCDLGDKEKGDIYQRYCAYLSASVAVRLIRDPRFFDA